MRSKELANLDIMRSFAVLTVMLLHMPVLYLVFRVWHTDRVILACAVYFSLSLLLPIVTYHLLENPLIDVGRRLSGSVNPQIARIAIA
jgi:peptidoglycan/LPS O-acetylase OafA/YrhL